MKFEIKIVDDKQQPKKVQTYKFEVNSRSIAEKILEVVHLLFRAAEKSNVV